MNVTAAVMFVSTASSLSELSSLHEGGITDFRNNYQVVQMKALPPIPDQDTLRAGPRSESRRARQDKGNYSDDELERRLFFLLNLQMWSFFLELKS